LRILLTNDDGIHADGLLAALRGLTRAGHDVLACAPDGQRSGSSHGVTLWRPMTVKRTKMPTGAYGYAVSGTPADAAHVGLTLHNDPPFDLVVSGVNNDTNLAYDINYSGTVGAALEATEAGFPAMAVSVENELPFDWDGVGLIVADLVSLYPSWDIPPGVAVNVNIPHRVSAPGYVWAAPHETTPFSYLERRQIDPDTLECVRQRTHDSLRPPSGTDIFHLAEGRVTVSAIQPVMGHPQTLARLSQAKPGRPGGE
jgi:5'-nucleotidase